MTTTPEAPTPLRATSEGDDLLPSERPVASTGPSVTATSQKVLRECVTAITNDPSLPPREGQEMLMNDIIRAMGTTHRSGGADGGQALAEAPTGVGKALDVDTPIPTPAGWKRMGNLIAGDEVFDETGNVCRVTEAFAVRYDRPCYEVVFSDGPSIVADGEHLWATDAAVETTDAIRARLESGEQVWIPAPGSAQGRFDISDVRPVESRPVRCIAVDSPNRLFLAGEAMIPTHNSFSYLVPAAVISAIHEERTVISTEMISLQTQIIDKDAPVVADAVEKVTGVRPEVALLKGWSNYACGQSAIESAQALVDEAGTTGSGLSAVRALIKRLKDRLEKAGATGPARRPDGKLDFAAMLGGEALSKEDRAKHELALWALEQTLAEATNGSGDGDQNAYTGTVDNYLWESVSVSSADCIGEKCPVADWCLPRKARKQAADADIVVTNHHLLAVQAAKAAPVVIGNRNMGRFDHIIVDEAHGLPSIVRNQGSVQISERAIKSAVKSVTWVLDDTDPKVAELVRDGDAVAARVGMELEEWARRIKPREEVLRLVAEDDPVTETAILITGWTKRAGDMLSKATDRTANHVIHMKAKRVRNRLDALNEAVKLVSVHEPGAARWVEVVTPHRKASDQTPYPVAQYTPVDVSRALERTLWTTDDLEAMEAQAEVAGVDPDAAPPRRSLTAIAMSATLPKGFGRQAGLNAPLRKYPSPFDTAYGNSVLYVPRAVDSTDVEALGSTRYGNKVKFDTAKHAEWASGHILDLVEANGGSALVLAATAGAGKAYAEALTAAARGRWSVASQWDGRSLKSLVDDWKADHSAVLVGTKSLMTGVDAAGETCTLVIVDRPARARSNPVDDARVEALVENLEMDKWDADRLVYVSDAALLLEQAAGRLIRRVTDSGMVAVLDPRLLKVGPFPYQHKTRNDYLETLFRFETKISDPAKATAWLRAHRAQVAGQKAS